MLIREIFENSKWLPLFRGEYSGNKGGKFWTQDIEFARQFTQSGRDREIIRRFIHVSDIYDRKPYAYGGEPDEIEAVVAKAAELGFSAVRLSEVRGRDDAETSIYVFDRSALKMSVRESDFNTSDPEFRKWFSGSKIVDRDGDPLLVWHGLKKPITHIDALNKRVLFSPEFHAFDVEKVIEPGAWFSPSEKIASQYGYAAPFFLRAYNPIRDESPLQTAPEGHDSVYRTRSSKSEIYNAWEIAVFDPAQIRLAFDLNAQHIKRLK